MPWLQGLTKDADEAAQAEKVGALIKGVAQKLAPALDLLLGAFP
jgi:hypothetical protein